jgi:hypothetical protein
MYNITDKITETENRPFQTTAPLLVLRKWIVQPQIAMPPSNPWEFSCRQPNAHIKISVHIHFSRNSNIALHNASTKVKNPTGTPYTSSQLSVFTTFLVRTYIICGTVL